jgi:acyl carrier protein
MSTLNITERVRKVIADHLGHDVEDVLPEMKISRDLGADSLDRVELDMAIEEEFNIEIDYATADKIKTVKNYIDAVDRLRMGDN